MWDHIFNYEMDQYITEAKNAYYNTFNKTITVIFDNLKNSKNKYIKNVTRCNFPCNIQLIKKYCNFDILIINQKQKT